MPRRIPSPEDLVELADKYRAQGNIGLAYTYSEPLIWYEYVYDTARLAREKGLKNVLVTNGYLNPEPLRELLPFIDAVNLDIKAWEDDFYRRRCEGRVGPVKKAAEIMAGKVHLEVTNLLIPGENDREERNQGTRPLPGRPGPEDSPPFLQVFPELPAAVAAHAPGGAGKGL